MLLYPVPAYLFSEVIVVDDRPTRGGCLPDFWEVTIGGLVSRVHVDPNISAVFVVGESRYANETVTRLKDIATWKSEAETMASRLAVTPAMLSEAADKLRGRIHFPIDYQDLVRTLARILDDAPPLKSAGTTGQMRRPLLERQLAMGSMALREIDGCRVETAAQAFPVVLEIMRKADAPVIRDQAGRMVRELLDFRVHLTRPGDDMIPDFYHSQETRMQQYFNSAFADEKQFFGEKIRVGGQLDAVIKHLAEVIKQDELAFATRRAILIVPHEIADKDELSPLGLVSIRAIPRFYDERCELSYSFTWRTVEALVGFPYSLYGSIRLGQDLTNQVRARLPETSRSRVSMGQLSYIAHSLHMFTEDFGQNIVRYIVNDATR
jgi:hypothetical protein